MDYLDMFVFACKSVGLVLAAGLIAVVVTNWQEDRKARKAIRQMRDRYYAEMKEEAVREAEEFLRELRERS